ncbi:hypothetical protein [Microbacterium sp. Marseille-Q6648]|uniref:DUF7882 family protein n=1 Tax=Microbacterium sp. Marseille-Q6648 TaxID=2937991 RepID=UPI00203C089A|nr:hypothetical protein [Microbacterium sp. Marseille-Q6648]
MGTLLYGSPPRRLEFDDATLAHLKVVIVTKLRRSESFTVSWQHPPDRPPGRSTLWLHPSIELGFEFDSPAPPDPLDRRWLEHLAHEASSAAGIVLTADEVVGGHVPEHDEPRHLVGAPTP